MENKLMENRLLVCCLFCSSLAGLFLVYFFQPTGFVEMGLSELQKNCTGKVKVTGTMLDVAITADGKYAGKLAPGVFVLSGKPLLGEKITAYGKAKTQDGACNILLEKVEIWNSY